MIAFAETRLGGEAIPAVWEITRGRDASLEQITGWLREHQAALVAERDRHGALLLRGFTAIDSAAAFAAVLEVIAPKLMDYVGGSAPREVVYGRVTTASHLPSTHSLALHQEMAYQAYRPDALALFCEVAPTEGGETPLADARAVTSRIDPDVRARFDEQGLGVRRYLPHPDQVEVKDSIPRPWTDVFSTDERAVAEHLAAQKGWSISWRADGSLHLWQGLLPAFKTHPRTGERVWANQLHYHTPECMLRWALRDGRATDAEHIRLRMLTALDTMDQVFHRDGRRVAVEDSEHVWDVLAASEVPLQWQRGDVLLLDNVLAMHGRRRFRGDRRILVGLIRDGDGAEEPASSEPRSSRGVTHGEEATHDVRARAPAGGA